MRRTTRRLALLMAALAIAACDDAAGPSPPAAQDLDIFVPALASREPPDDFGDRSSLSEDPGEDADVPDEFDAAPAILRSRLIVDFTSTRAYAQAMMEFWGNRGRQDVALDLHYGGKVIATKTASGRRSEILPGIYRIYTTASVAVSGDCGHMADGASNHDAWHEYGAWEWGSETQENFDDEAQPDCEKEERIVQGGNNEDDAEWYICYYTHYYDAETGVYLYTKFHGCEPL